MNSTMIKTASAAVLALGTLLTVPAVAQNGKGGTNGRGSQTGAGAGASCAGNGSVLSTYLASLPKEAVSSTEQAGLLFTWEEEKLARDVYRALFAANGLRPFSNIAGAEQKHMDDVAWLLARYGIANPASGNAEGVFANARLQSLYTALVAQGRASVVEAAKVGATIEDLDLADVGNELARTDNRDVATVYQNLSKGSRNHLRAFVSILGANGGSYQAQYLPAADLAAILAAPQERRVVYDESGKALPMPAGTGTCGGNGRGRGMGNGNGRGMGNGMGNGGRWGQGNGTCMGGQGQQGGGTGTGTGICDGTGPHR